MQHALVLLLVALDELRGGRVSPPSLLVLQMLLPHQLNPAAAGLEAETCKQTKRKRGGARGKLEPPQRQAGLPPPAAFSARSFISGVQA